MARRLGMLAFAAIMLSASGAQARTYDVFYDVRIVPTERAAQVEIRVGSGAENLKELDMGIDPERHFDFRGDGKVDLQPTRVKWMPPPTGGSLKYTFLIDHLRDDRSYDARCTKTWALFRGDDLVPPARTRVIKGSTSRSHLRLRVPDGWTRAAPFKLIRGGEYEVSDPARGFDRPTGWIVAGRLGAIRQDIEGVQVAVAGPEQHGFRRLDLLAMLRWTFPSLKQILGVLPPRLLVVGAGDPMWRGGLSGPNSVYVHARRPLIAEDGTSPLLHEVMHSMLEIRGADGGDWIVEGLAEYYSLELLARSGTLGRERIDRVLAKIAARGSRVTTLASDRASGDRVARAVSVFHDLDRDIRTRTEDAKSLDDVVRRLISVDTPVTQERLATAANEATGLDFEAFFQGIH